MRRLFSDLGSLAEGSNGTVNGHSSAEGNARAERVVSSDPPANKQTDIGADILARHIQRKQYRHLSAHELIHIVCPEPDLRVVLPAHIDLREYIFKSGM